MADPKGAGIDRSVICRGRERKSVGHERTYSDDIIDREIIDQSLENFIAQGIERLRKHNYSQKTINLKVKYQTSAYQTEASLSNTLHVTRA